jgi:hypothetical protein
MTNVTEPVDVLSEWYYIEGEVEGVTNLLIDAVPLTVPVDQYLQFSLTIPDSGWPVGTYKLVIYVNGVEKMEVPFAVEAAPSLVSDVTMSLDVDDDARPINPTSVFPAGTTRVYTTLYVSPEVPAGTKLIAEWYSLDGDSPSLFDVYDFDVEGDYDYYFYYDVPDGWPAGEYAVVVYLGGEQQAIVYYSVE